MADVIGVTGWTFAQIGAMTYPQLEWAQKYRGQMLWPQVQPARDAMFGNVSGEKGPKGEPSDIEKMLAKHQAELRARQQGTPLPDPTRKERDRTAAYRVFNGYYLGEEDAPPERGTPIPGMTRAQAQEIIDAVKAGEVGEAQWARDLAHAWDDIKATARKR